jgi:hypothetical protein
MPIIAFASSLVVKNVFWTNCVSVLVRQTYSVPDHQPLALCDITENKSFYARLVDFSDENRRSNIDLYCSIRVGIKVIAKMHWQKSY